MKKGKSSRFINWLEIFVILFLTWIVMSGIFELKFMIYAVLTCAIIAFICVRTLEIRSKKSDRAYFLLHMNYIKLFIYFWWLIWQILKAAWDVSMVTLFKREEINPSVVWFKIHYDNPLAIALLANSITLTPGTITVDVTEGIFSVHALTKSAAEGLLDGSMQAKIAWLYNEPSETEPIVLDFGEIENEL